MTTCTPARASEVSQGFLKICMPEKCLSTSRRCSAESPRDVHRFSGFFSVRDRCRSGSPDLRERKNKTTTTKQNNPPPTHTQPKGGGSSVFLLDPVVVAMLVSAVAVVVDVVVLLLLCRRRQHRWSIAPTSQGHCISKIFACVVACSLYRQLNSVFRKLDYVFAATLPLDRGLLNFHSSRRSQGQQQEK